ncbi:hypothetical protein OG738_34685 [Amycolatopsis sp. NBC_01488]|uniref:hypothetical protein n=1 Tax=Amycolatopsis sp. NBC_01488 TaxID=2903563 RepID=UPI002E285480|nr:hypothetical protein [Amycolatopsis sp. NBC_01488]
MTHSDLRADGRPLPSVRPDATEDDEHLWIPSWTLSDPAAARRVPPMTPLIDTIALTQVGASLP